MFHKGQYLEVIKVSDNLLATAIVTVKEKMVLIDKKKILTNKWLNLDDWSELYKILQKAILRNSKISEEKNNYKSSERKKSTKRLDVVYTFESSDDSTSLPTIKVQVSSVKRKLRSSVNTEKKVEKENNQVLPPIYSNDSPEMKIQRLMEGIESSPEEYVPSELSKKSSTSSLNYIPSSKCYLKKSHRSSSDEYTPASESKSKNTDVEMTYIPNPICKLDKKNHDTYEPGGISNLSPSLSEAYVPSLKNSNEISIEEYQPDFPSTATKFDTSYVPSTKKHIETNNNDKVKKKSHKKSLSCKKTVISSSNSSKREL